MGDEVDGMATWAMEGNSMERQGKHSAQCSDVAALLERIRLEYEAAQRGLTGLSCGEAQHDFIAANTHKELAVLVGDEQQAIRLIAEVIWED